MATVQPWLRLRLPILLALTALTAPSGPTQAITIPAGFNQINSWQGTGSGGTGPAIRVYRKDFMGGQPDFVTVVDLRYATLRSINGTASGAANCQAVSTRLLCSSTSGGCQNGSHWNVANGTAGLRVLLNAAFFATGNNPAGIAFGLRNNGTIISYGYGVNGGGAVTCAAASEFPGNTFTLRFTNSSDQAAAGGYNSAHFSDPTFVDVVGGLNPTCCKSPSSFVARTMAGVHDSNGDGLSETVLFYSSAFARLTDGDTTLRAFGASSTIQLDGGGSTGLVVNGSQLIATTRPMPHAIAAYAQ